MLAVFGVVSGGVAVAAPVAVALGADLDVLKVCRLTMPGWPDRAWGALSTSGERVYVVAEQDAEAVAITPADVPDSASQRELTVLRQLQDTKRSGRPPDWVRGRPVLVVGDGLASVAAMRAAASALRKPARPVGPRGSRRHRPNLPGIGQRC